LLPVVSSKQDAMIASVEKISVALTPDMVAELRAAVEGGDYGSVSEVVRDALRDWRLRRKIETLETEGTASVGAGGHR
jgi:antitoxin ParD1/3/4